MKRENENFDRFEKKRFIDLIRSVYFIWFDKSFNHKYRLNTHTNQFQPTFYSKKIIRRQKKKKKKMASKRKINWICFCWRQKRTICVDNFLPKMGEWVLVCWHYSVNFIFHSLHHFDSKHLFPISLYIVHRIPFVHRIPILHRVHDHLCTVHCTLYYTYIYTLECDGGEWATNKEKKLRRKRNKVLQT